MRDMTIRLTVNPADKTHPDPLIVVVGEVIDTTTKQRIGVPRDVQYQMSGLAGLTKAQALARIRGDLLPLLEEEVAEASERTETVNALAMLDKIRELDGAEIPVTTKMVTDAKGRLAAVKGSGLTSR